MRRLWLILLLMAFASPLAAAGFEGVVVRVKDGDSLLIERARERRVEEVRLHAIDAPELGQPWGIQARSALRRLVQGRPVRVETLGRDRYGRWLGRVTVGRVDVNLALVEGGHAWAVRGYGAGPALVQAQRDAKAAGRGLWALPPDQRLPPATWRDRFPREGRE
ncbi:MAG: thermonuclease family protein [Sphingomonadaceae bacterium]